MAAKGGIKGFFRRDNLWDNPRDNHGTTSKNGTTSKKFRRDNKKAVPRTVPQTVPWKSLVNKGKNGNLGQRDNFSL